MERLYGDGQQQGSASCARQILVPVTEQRPVSVAVDEYGNPPDINDYMPNWPDAERTHLMMYETTSEGTPISPAFRTPEELARWLADNKASAFGSMTASYESWLEVARGGWAPSAIYTPETGLVSGVEGVLRNRGEQN